MFKVFLTEIKKARALENGTFASEQIVTLMDTHIFLQENVSLTRYTYTGCYEKSFTNLFRRHIQCFELS
jgi:hypothetical protein